MIRINRTQLRRFFAACLPLLYIGLADMAMAAPNCNKNPDHPKCVTEPPPDPGGPANPKVAYVIDGQIYIGNADGSGMTLIRSETDGSTPRLYAGPTGGKVLFYKYIGYGRYEYLAYRSYSLVDGEVVADTQDQVLVWDSQLDAAFPGGGNFTGFGLNDWSPDGTGYAYSFHQTTDNGAIYRIMYAPSLDAQFPNEHVIIREGLPDGGQNSAQWDASGDFIYMTEDYNDSPVHDLLVIDVTTNPGDVVASVSITGLLTATGFPAASNGGASEAGSITGSAAEPSSCDTGPCYSFGPGLPARWDTSLCLLTSWVDWDSRHQTRFAIILDLPSIFESEPQVSCPVATPAGTAIQNFNAWEFTANDEGIVGENQSRKRYGGTWIYDLRPGTEGTRTKISDERAADWAN